MTPAIRWLNGALSWRGALTVEADGAARAYAPPPLSGLDCLANAGKPGHWYGVVTDAAGAPVVQGPGDAAPGYYVSPTALCDHARALTDPRRYVDSERVPYVSVPPELLHSYGVRLGDFAVAARGDLWSTCLVADVGPAGHYGEGSIALAERIGVPSSPRNGGCQSGVIYLLWPGSSRGWPIPPLEIEHEAGGRFVEWGGVARLRAVYP